jgi:hypothetical protein
MWQTLLARDRLLTLIAAGMLGGAVLIGVVAWFDDQTITGVNRWIKPLKFLVSIGIFLITMAWLMPDVLVEPRTRRRLSRVFAGAMVIEVLCIAGQAARGTTSHFNVTTPFDGAIFQVMGAAITVNTIAAAVMLRYLRHTGPPERAGYLLGVRLGLALFVLASLQGYVIVANMGHTVPGPDGGPGLPVVNWALERGDLRIAHFIGLHALQALPLLGYGLDRSGVMMPALRRAVVGTMAIIWLGAMGVTLAVALRGQPLWAQ